MAILTNKQLVEQVLKMAGYDSPVEKTVKGFEYHKDRYGYVFGGQGELYTKDLAEKWARERRSGEDSDYFLNDCKQWYTPPRKVVDCSGMVVQAFRAYDKSYGDRTANTFKAQFVKGGTIKTIPAVAGIAVWKKGHIGIYLGDGRDCQSKGHDHGVVIGQLSSTPWTHWGYLADVEYVQDTPTPKPKTDKPKLTRLLKYIWYDRMKGDDVALVQQALKNAGFNIGRYGKNRDGIDGIYGKVTYGAVWRYQKKHGLRIDGIVGPQTWGHMFA